MAKPARAHVQEEAESADLVVMATVNPLLVFTDEQKFSEFYEKLKAEVEKHKPDVSTEKGRTAVRSLAFKVTRAKTSLNDARLGLTKAWRDQIDVVNEAGKKMTTELAALAEETRRPLTEWEEVEKARVARCQAVIQQFRTDAIISEEDTAETVRQRGKTVFEVEIGDEFGDLKEEAEGAKEAAIATLGRAMNRLIKEEEDRAELARLRAENEAREAVERKREYAQRIIQHCRDCSNGIIGGQSQPFGILIHELEEKVPLEREGLGDFWPDVDQARVEALARINEVRENHEAEVRRQSEAAEAERIRVAEERAAENAREEAARIAREAEEARQREHDAAIAEERRQREEAERVAQAERDERERQDAERRAEEARVAAETARIAEEDRKREANRAHRARIQKAAKEAIMACGCAEAIAQDIVRAIVAGKVPAVTLKF